MVDTWDTDLLFMRVLNLDFGPAFKAMLDKMYSKIGEKGFSYRDCKESYLLEKLKEEIKEFESNPNLDEAIDAANMAIMLVYRKLQDRGKENDK